MLGHQADEKRMSWRMILPPGDMRRELSMNEDDVAVLQAWASRTFSNIGGEASSPSIRAFRSKPRGGVDPVPCQQRSQERPLSSQRRPHPGTFANQADCPAVPSHASVAMLVPGPGLIDEGTCRAGSTRVPVLFDPLSPPRATATNRVGTDVRAPPSHPRFFFFFFFEAQLLVVDKGSRPSGSPPSGTAPRRRFGPPAPSKVKSPLLVRG